MLLAMAADSKKRMTQGLLSTPIRVLDAAVGTVILTTRSIGIRSIRLGYPAAESVAKLRAVQEVRVWTIVHRINRVVSLSQVLGV